MRRFLNSESCQINRFFRTILSKLMKTSKMINCTNKKLSPTFFSEYFYYATYWYICRWFYSARVREKRLFWQRCIGLLSALVGLKSQKRSSYIIVLYTNPKDAHRKIYLFTPILISYNSKNIYNNKKFFFKFFLYNFLLVWEN